MIQTITCKADYNFRFDIRVSGRVCGRCAPTRKLWKHAGAENQNKRGLCVSGYFPLGRSPLFACYDFLKKDVWLEKRRGILCMRQDTPKGYLKRSERVANENADWNFDYSGNIARRYFRNHDKSTLRSGAHRWAPCAHRNLYFVMRTFVLNKRWSHRMIT